MSEKISPGQCHTIGGQVSDNLFVSDANREKVKEAIDSKNHPFWTAFDSLVATFFVAVAVAKETIIEWITDLTVPAQKKFVVADHFTKNNKEVKFWGFGSNLEIWFIPMTENEVGKATVAIGKLRVQAKLADMTPEMPAPRLVTMSQIYWMLSQQPHGEQPNGKNRLLLADGSSNLFRAPDKDGIERAVYARWYDGGWSVSASDLEFQRVWGAGGQVVSLKSLDAR